MTQPTVPVDIPPKPRTRRPGKSNQVNTDVLPKIRLDLDDISRNQVHLLERPHLEEFVSRAKQEIEEAAKEGIKLGGKEKWHEIVRNVEGGEPSSTLDEYEFPDPNDMKKPTDIELRTSVRFYVWYRRAILNAVRRLRDEEYEDDNAGDETDKEKDVVMVKDRLIEDEDGDDDPPGRRHRRKRER